MASVFEKLNLKDQREILVLNAPTSFEPELGKLAGIGVRRRIPKGGKLEFALVFATEQLQVDAAARELAKLAPGDAVVWFAYPKGSSKRYKCSFNRDTGWKALGRAGFEPVRQVAIDEDWSALRFRRAEFIKSMTRAPEHALSTEGKEKAGRASSGPVRAGYSGTPLARKLGIAEGDTVCTFGAPGHYKALLAPLPPSVRFVTGDPRDASIVHVFSTSRRELARTLGELYPRIKPDGVVWVSWPKKAAKLTSEVTEDVVRELALPLGFVDVKVCAVDEVWSGLKLVIRKANRASRS